MKFSASELVDQVCVVGSALPQPMALITLSEAGRKKTAEELQTEFKNLLKEINSSLDSHEKMSKIVVLKDQWLVENNLLTPSLKIKRNEIEKRYGSFYSEWDEIPGPVAIVNRQ